MQWVRECTPLFSNFGLGMQGVALNLGEGNFEYQVDMERYADGVRMRSTGTLSVTPPVATRNVTPAMPLSNGAVVNNGVVGYLWSQPAWDRKPLYRYYFLRGNGHHITTADANVVAEFDAMIANDQAAGNTPWIMKEGILGYVQAWPTANSQRLYQYIYGGETIFRLTANPADIGAYQTLYSHPRNIPGFQFQPGTWYQNAYQDDGYISSVPVEGTIPLYSVYYGNSIGAPGAGATTSPPTANSKCAGPWAQGRGHAQPGRPETWSSDPV